MAGIKKRITDGIITNAEVDRIKQSVGIYSRKNLRKFDRFYPYGYMETDTDGLYREYIFFTKPHLNIESMKYNSPYYYKFIKESYPHICNLLSSGGGGFIPLLTNSHTITSSSGVDIPDAISMENETMSNVYGAMIKYKGHSLESRYNKEFTVEFSDSSFLDVYMLFHIWEQYSTMKNLGLVQTYDQYRAPANILDDQVSAFIIKTGDDNEHIVYMGKWTGVFPTNTPSSVFTTMEGGAIKMSIQFESFLYEDKTPEIIFDFISVSGGNKQKERPMYKGDYVGAGTTFDSYHRVSPFIVKGKLHGRSVYKLKWR